MPKDVKYAAYLDVYTLDLSDIRRIFEQLKLDGKVIGVVVDPGVGNCNDEPLPYIKVECKDKSHFIIQISKSTYFNVGVFLLNLIEWRALNIGSNYLDLAQKFRPKYHDQNFLNYVCLGNVKLLDLTLNFNQADKFIVKLQPKIS